MSINGNSTLDGLYFLANSVPIIKNKAKVYITAIIGSLTTTWASITGKPTTFPPETHEHVEADITDLQVYALVNNVILLDNTTPFTPDADYEPATKKYVDDNGGGAFSGTMDDIDNGATYVKTENNLTDALVSTIGTALQSETSHADVLVTGDIGSTVQGYSANTVVDASYVHTDNNFTTALDSKLDGIEASAVALATVKADADIASAISLKHSNANDHASGSDDQDLSGKANVAQTFYIGTTQIAINRASAALTLAGLTLTTPDAGTPSALVGTNISGTAANLTAGKATVLATGRTLNGVSFDGSANILVPTTNKVTSTTVTTGTAARTLTGAQIVAGNIQELTGTTTRLFTFDTGSNISTAYTAAYGATNAGNSCTFLCKCSGTSTGTITFAGGVGSTLQSSGALAIGQSRMFILVNTGANTWSIF
jgi:hypothetical protein